MTELRNIQATKQMQSFKHFDAHMHLLTNKADWWTDTLVANMDANGVVAGAISGVALQYPNSDEEVQRVAARYPGRLLPLISHIDLNKPSELARVIAELKTGRWAGVGELFLDASRTIRLMNDPLWYPLPKDGTANRVLGGLIEYCTSRRLPVLIHIEDTAVLEDLLERYPNNTIVWAHCDYMTPLANVRRILDAYPHLWVDFGPMIRCGYWDTQNGASNWLDTSRDFWLEMCDNHFSRLLLGTDTIHEKYATADRYRHIYESYTDFFGRLPNEKVQAMVTENFLQVFASYLQAHPEFAVGQNMIPAEAIASEPKCT